jgi:hypothetical protein
LREHRVQFNPFSSRVKHKGCKSCNPVRKNFLYRLLEKLTGKATKPPVAGGGGDKKLTADEWLAEQLKKGK